MKPTNETTQEPARRKPARRIDIPSRAENAAAEAVEDHIEAAVEDATGQMLDFEAFEAEFEEKGALSQASYALLARAGVPRAVVDRHIEGRLAAHEKLAREILDLAGGSERYWRMSEWARAALTPEAFARYEASLRGDPSAVKAVVADLSEIYAGATGDRAGATGDRAGATADRAETARAKPRGERAPTPAPRPAEPMPSEPPRPAPMGAAQRFASAEQLAKAIRDPRYRADPAYRAWVAETVARSDVFGRNGAKTEA